MLSTRKDWCLGVLDIRASIPDLESVRMTILLVARSSLCIRVHVMPLSIPKSSAPIIDLEVPWFNFHPSLCWKSGIHRPALVELLVFDPSV